MYIFSSSKEVNLNCHGQTVFIKMSFIRLASLSFFLALFFPKPSVCQMPNCNDCCTNYQNISDPRRSTKSIWKPGETPLCDRGITWGWYRFTSFGGTKMPETVVPEYRCGTHDPVWLKEPHPTVAEGTLVRKACINSFGMNNGCFHTFDISITNCGGYFVYYLGPLRYCAAAYCAGKKYYLNGVMFAV